MNVIILCLIKSDFISVTRLFFYIRFLITFLPVFPSCDCFTDFDKSDEIFSLIHISEGWAWSLP